MNELIELETGIIDGVTAPTIKKIRDAEITTLQALSRQSTKDLSEKAGIGEDTAKRAITRAREMIDQGYITAKQLVELRSSRTRLHTGSYALDDLIGGGIESQTTTELIGDYATGKTQLSHQLAVNAQLSIEKSGFNGNVVWIDTEDTFRPERIIQICENRGLDKEKLLNGIWHSTCYNTAHQRLLIEQLYSFCPERNIKLVIIDSVLGHLRGEYIGRGMLSARQDELKRMLLNLRKVALSTKTTIIYTNQVMDDPSVIYGNPEKPTGGHVMGHAASTRLHLRKGRRDQRIAKLIDSLSLPEGEAVFRITDMGIEDVEGYEPTES